MGREESYSMSRAKGETDEQKARTDTEREEHIWTKQHKIKSKGKHKKKKR